MAWLVLIAAAAAIVPPDEIPAREAVTSSSDVVALSPGDRAAALDAGADRAGRELPINGLPSRVHGEVGASIDSRGGRGVYGASTVPLGQTGSASVFFSNQTGGRWRR